MKKVREFSIVVAVLILIVLVVNAAFGGYDYNPLPKPPQDILDALMPVPVATLDKFGHTERTKLIFNIARLLEIAKSQQLKIKILEGKVSGLEKRIIALETSVESVRDDIVFIDPNEVLE